jgi:hypothetical protein
MSKFEKILIVLLMGSLWGALELFGGDAMRALGIPNKSAFLFALGLIILYASKRMVDFTGSVIIMALIAGLFKTASAHFYACQFAAVMINGAVFDISYKVFKNQLDSSPIYRSVAAPVIAYMCYTIFAVAAAYAIGGPEWRVAGLQGIADYLAGSGLIAAAASIVTINLGYYLGNILRPIVVEKRTGIPVSLMKISTLVIVAAIWVAGQIY